MCRDHTYSKQSGSTVKTSHRKEYTSSENGRGLVCLEHKKQGAESLKGKWQRRCEGRLSGFRLRNTVKGDATHEAAGPAQRQREEENNANLRNVRLQVSQGHWMEM